VVFCRIPIYLGLSACVAAIKTDPGADGRLEIFHRQCLFARVSPGILVRVNCAKSRGHDICVEWPTTNPG